MTQIADRPPSKYAVPPLSNGDHLSLAEFERLWDLHPDIKKAELIDGVVFLEMSVSPIHSIAHAAVMLWLGLYWASRSKTVELHDNVTLSLLGVHDLQPDSLLRLIEGASRWIANARIEGPPELVVEVSASSASRDLGVKRRIYADAGVAEYVVWQLYENRLDWFVLESGEYVSLQPGSDGIIESRVFPGLRLSPTALLDGDIPALVAAANSSQLLAPNY